MLAGGLYDAADPELHAERERCGRVLHRHNAEPDSQVRRGLLEELLAGIGADTDVRAPFWCDYGYNITLGAGVFINFNCVMLDVAPIIVGDRVQIASSVQFLAADHPVEPTARRTGVESGRPIGVGDNAWIGGGAILCPGVTVGHDSVIGAGSVVTRDIPAGVVAAGNPCRVIREV